MSLRPRSGQTYAGSDLYHVACQRRLKKKANRPSQYNLAKSESGLVSLTAVKIAWLRAGCMPRIFAR